MKYKKESHLRSLLKSMSWRVIATSDTILIVLLFTCLNGQCSVEEALTIGFYEFILKLAVYYVHERIWQLAYKEGVIHTKGIILKTMSWRILATTTTFIIVGSVFNSYNLMAFYIAITELISKIILYYMHEKLWLKVPLGSIRRFLKK